MKLDPCMFPYFNLIERIALHVAWPLPSSPDHVNYLEYGHKSSHALKPSFQEVKEKLGSFWERFASASSLEGWNSKYTYVKMAPVIHSKT